VLKSAKDQAALLNQRKHPVDDGQRLRGGLVAPGSHDATPRIGTNHHMPAVSGTERPKRRLEYGAGRRGDPRFDLLASDRRVSRSKTCFTARERFLERNSPNAAASPQLGIHQDGAGPDLSREFCLHRALRVKTRECATDE
jgi:hypothetical protein